MIVNINEQEYNVKFTFRVLNAILEKVKISSLADAAQLASKIGPGTLPDLIHLAIQKSLITKAGKSELPVPSKDDVVWALEEDISISRQFFSELIEGIALMFPENETPDAGN